MSLFLASSPKHCAKRELSLKKLINKKLIYTISTFLLTILSLILLVWFILHPSKPEFNLKDTDIYQLSLSPPHLLNSTITITLLSKNPNTRVGIYYDRLRVYAVYKGEQISDDATLPPFYQGHEDTNLLSTSLSGTGLPVNPSFGYEVGRDQTAGKLILVLKMDGQLRWKVGTWVSGRYRIDVNCVAVMGLRPGAGPGDGPLGSTQGAECSTSV